MELKFKNVKIEDKWRLPKVANFRDVSVLLGHSRLMVCWVALGLGIGIYDHTLKYIDER